jgi:hypothetical protein
LLVLAAVVRSGLEESGLLEDEELLGVTPDPRQASVQLAISKLVRRYQNAGRLQEAAGAMVWLHSLRALSAPELRHLGRLMWQQLQRGQSHTIEAAQTMGLPPLSTAIRWFMYTPDDLNPADLPR